MVSTGSDPKPSRARRRGSRTGRRRVRWGIRGRVTGTATLVVALALLISGVALTYLIGQSLVSGLDANQAARAQAVSAQISAAGSIRGTIPQNARQSSVVQVLNAKGQVIAATANMHDGDDYENAVLGHPPENREATVSTLSDSPLDSSARFRVLAQPVTLSSGPGWIYVAGSLGQVDAARTNLVVLFAVGLPLLLLVVALVVWRAVSQSLAPVDRIRAQAAVIGAADLTQRVPVPRSDDEIGRLAVTMNEMLDRLESAAVRQNQFIGDASHELRSPLAAVRAQVEVALAHPDSAEAARVLFLVHEEVERMTMLTEDLLFLARSTEGEPMTVHSSVDVDELVLFEVDRLRKRNDLLVTLVGLDAARVVGSRRDLARALRNLTDNACDHARTEVSIALRARGDLAEVIVDDDGPGVVETDREKIFERFTRIDDARARNLSHGGFGLGLAIARRIVLRHGGTLTVHDRADGAPGAEFRLRLPVIPG